MNDSEYLDNIKTYETYDTLGMKNHIENFDLLCKNAWTDTGKTTSMLSNEYKNLKNIVIFGMGGSAIGGDLLAGLFINECKVPITVIRSYDLPAYIDENTLAIICSYSGNTEETLSIYEQALSNPCKKITIAHGGQLEELSKENKTPFVKIEHLSPPRAAVPANMVCIFRVLNDLGYINNKETQFNDALSELNAYIKELNINVPTDNNFAKQLAIQLKDKVTIIYGGEFLHQVAHRWTAQINENAKNWSFYSGFSEVDHIDISQYPNPAAFKQLVSVIILRSEFEHPRNYLRCEVTADILSDENIEQQIIDITGKTKLSQMLKAIILGDYISLYLAMFNKIEPASTEVITKLKQVLAKH